jgi:hypothetical protein
MLNAKINIQSHEFSYRTLPLPEAAKNAKPLDSDIILPLLFEVTLNICIQEKTEKVILRAPGTISGTITADVDQHIICLQFPIQTIAKK